MERLKRILKLFSNTIISGFILCISIQITALISSEILDFSFGIDEKHIIFYVSGFISIFYMTLKFMHSTFSE